MNLREKAQCRDAPAELFFPPVPGDPAQVIQTYCRRCPVREGCRATALTMPSQAGIWGGTVPADREATASA